MRSHLYAGDFDGVWALHLKTVSENDGFVKNLAFHVDLNDIPQLYEAFFVMREEKEIIGMVGLRRIDGQTLEVKRLQVAKTHQGKGYGRMLMDHVLDYALACKASYLRLDVSEPQAKARELYLAMGFKITDTKERFLGPDDERFLSTYMEKEL